MNREEINSDLLALGTDMWSMRYELDQSDPNYAVYHHELRLKAAKVLSATLLSDTELKKFMLEEIVATANELDQHGLYALADHIMPRLDGFFFRKNYDYGEGWHDMMEKFRKGKIRGVKEWLDQRRKPKKKRKKKSHHVLSRGAPGDMGYVVSIAESDGIDLGAGMAGGVPDLNSEIVKITRDEEASRTHARALIAKYEELVRQARKNKKKGDKREVNYPNPFDSYCDSKRTRQYWMEMKKNEGSDAIEDFLNYIKEIDCPKDGFRLSASRRRVDG